MAMIKSISMGNENIEVNVTVSRREYETLKNSIESDIIILPSDSESLSYELTTGKLGNSNRVMLPKKFLVQKNIRELEKKVPANIFNVNGDAYLLIKLRSVLRIPRFA